MTNISASQTLCEAFQRTAAVDPAAVALREFGGERALTWRCYADRVRAVAGGMAALGIGRGDTIALMMGNRPEFHIVDAAAIHLGAIPFSLYCTSAPEQIQVILGNAESRLAVVEAKYATTVRAFGGGVEHLVVVDGPADGALSLDELAAAGAADFDFESAWRAVEPDDVVSLIYTSGTTGAPKGVELTHTNLLAEIGAVLELFEVRHGDRVISYLPSAHIADRLACHYLQIVKGTQITTLADTRRLVDALRDVRPDYLTSVPRVWEKLKIGLDTVIDGIADPRRQDVASALELGRRRVAAEREGLPLSEPDAERYAELDRTALAPIRAALGFDRLRWGMSGAAPIARETLEFFMALGIPVCEIWGMSETVGAVTVNPPGKVKAGTVGTVLRGVEFRIAADGEAFVRGSIVMRGYRRDPERTAEVLGLDGWLATGDVVEMDDEGYVRIVDRKKELIINAAGKNMSPTNIELAIKAACPLVAQAVTIGDGRRYVTALIVLDQEAAAGFAAKRGIVGSSPFRLTGEPAVIDAVRAGIATANTKLSRVEQVKRFRIVPEFWEPGGTELTATMKLKRKPIAAKYADDIEAMYDGAPGVAVWEPVAAPH